MTKLLFIYYLLYIICNKGKKHMNNKINLNENKIQKKNFLVKLAETVGNHSVGSLEFALINLSFLEK